MRWLISKLFSPRPIVLTGTVLAPLPGQILVLSTPEVLSPAQRAAVQRTLAGHLPDLARTVILEAGTTLSVEYRPEQAKGGDDER